MNLNDEIVNSLLTFRSQIVVDDSDFLLHLHMDENEYKKLIKEKLIQQLVNELMSMNHIEFTAQEDVSRMSKIYRARLVTIPSNVVEKLRKEGKVL